MTGTCIAYCIISLLIIRELWTGVIVVSNHNLFSNFASMCEHYYGIRNMMLRDNICYKMTYSPKCFKQTNKQTKQVISLILYFAYEASRKHHVQFQNKNKLKSQRKWVCIHLFLFRHIVFTLKTNMLG